MRREKGFTLIELMTAVGIGALLVSLAVPGIKTLTMNSKHRNGVNELVSAMHLARNTAITTNTRVTLCASKGGSTCESVAWESGWIVFADLNSNQAVDGAEVVLRASGGANGLTMKSTEFSRFLMFRPSGRVMSATATTNVGDFAVCDDRGSDHAKVVSIELSGRPRVLDKSSGGMSVSCG